MSVRGVVWCVGVVCWCECVESVRGCVGVVCGVCVCGVVCWVCVCE